MKLAWKQIDPFVKNPDPAARVILVYGPDDGLMRTRLKTMALTVVSDLNDPFNVAVLNASEISADPAKLIDEASAISMMGGNRVVRIESAGDGLTPALKAYLENPSDHTLVLIESGELGPRSPLRILCEKAANAAAVPCYVEEGRNLANVIRSALSDEGFTASPDAMEWLCANLAGDRGRVTSELEKLKLYMGEEKRIELKDVQAACGTGGAESMDDFVYALAGRQPAQMLKSFTKLNEEGVPLITMLRALQNHFRRLHITQTRIEKGQQQNAALDALNPKIFFKYKDSFQTQLSSWTSAALISTLEKLSELEARCKQTGIPAETVCTQAFLSIALRK